MRLVHDAAPRLLLLLMAELFVGSSSHAAVAAAGPSLCGLFASMIHRVEKLLGSSKELHGLSDAELLNFAGVEHRLDSLPQMLHSAAYFSSLKLGASLSELYVNAGSFRLHTDWLKTAKENSSLPSESAGGASALLLQLSSLLNASLHQIREEVPPPPSAVALPVASTAFDALQFSIEISERLRVFCMWSKRVLRYLQKLSRCPRR